MRAINILYGKHRILLARMHIMPMGQWKNLLNKMFSREGTYVMFTSTHTAANYNVESKTTQDPIANWVERSVYFFGKSASISTMHVLGLCFCERHHDHATPIKENI